MRVYKKHTQKTACNYLIDSSIKGCFIVYCFEARYYRVHTFISRDPLMNEKPWLTPYHYCSNNPIGRIDPSGMSDDWYQDADGNVKWDENVTSQADLKQEEKYIGKTVGWINDNGLHKGDENGNITTKDLHVTIIGNRNTEGIKDIEGQTLTINASSIGYNKTPWMDIAKTQIGVTKAIGHNDGVQIEKYLKSVGLGKGHPWCAAFVNWCLNQAGNEGAGARRNNYLNWGIPLNEPKYGAVAIFNTGHVGFYAEKNGENYKILHGNWSDKVSFSTNIKPSEIKFFRFPK